MQFWIHYYIIVLFLMYFTGIRSKLNLIVLALSAQLVYKMIHTVMVLILQTQCFNSILFQ